MYESFATETFKKIFESLTAAEQVWIEKTKEKLKEQPTGKVLEYDWFREKKHLDKRLYFLVDDRSKKLLFISFAGKKEQQAIIDFVRKNKQELLEHLRAL